MFILIAAIWTREKFSHHFPIFTRSVLVIGINVAKVFDPLHCCALQCDKTADFARTSSRNLLCCGECASTGLMVPNRVLHEHSLLEHGIWPSGYLDSITRLEEFERQTLY
jgi:aspartate oxidase